MKAAVVHARGDISLEDIPIPEVPEGSIRLKVASCAICGTDLRILWRGDHRAVYPVVVGHEIAGVVDATATGVSGVKVGDRVCVAPGHGCGECRMCRIGKPNVCLRPYPSLGYEVNGGFEEYFAVPENIFRLGFVNLIPDSLSFRQAALSEIVACCINGQNNSPVNKDDVVLVIGSGPAGIIHTQLARAAGARRIILTQRSRPRLELAAERFQVDRIVASTEEDLEAAVMEETGGAGADVVFVCAPSGAAQETATRLVAPRGRVNLFGGLPPDERVISLDANALHYKEFFLAGASSSLPEDNRRALELLASLIIDPDKLITDVYPIDEVLTAFRVAGEKRGIKTVVDFM